MCGVVGLASVCALVKAKFTTGILLSPRVRSFPDSQPDLDEVAVDVVAMSLLLEQGEGHSCLIICQRER